MLISTTNLNESYEVIDVIMFLDTFEQKGFFEGGGYDFDTSFEAAKKKMAKIARTKGGDAIIGCDFELRVAVKQGFVASQVFELFCFGPVVKIHDRSQENREI
jgi:hypothetical protein